MNYPFYGGYQFPQCEQSYRQSYPSQSQSIPLQDEKIYVQGEAGALAYLVAPNSFVRLWDSTADCFYEKRADQTGKPYMEVFEYKRRGTEKQEEAPQVDYIERFESLEKRLSALENARKDGGRNVRKSDGNDKSV